MRLFTMALLLSAAAVPAARAADLRYFDDAALHAVQFVDENEGWSVGDDGVVWHTIDGGGTWERQPSGVRSSLRSVHFLNPYTGWIAGREELPHGQGSIGVLLVTRDGGLKWQRVGTHAVPGLNCVRFVDGKTGFAVGDGTDQFPTGIFRTVDAGRTWQPVPGPRAPAWLTADFQDSQTGALGGAWSRLAALRQGGLLGADVDTLGGRSIRGMQVVGKRAVAVGQGGTVLLSRDSAGARWGYADLKLATEVRACWDFHAVHCVGDQIWIVGRPGSVVLHSHDQGQSWETMHTGQPLPLDSVFFINGQRGWAVGELGSILATNNGGKTWRVQHRGGQRTGVLFVHARATDLPVDTVAQLGGEEGYLATGIRVLASDPASAAPDKASESERFAAAMRQSGGASAEMVWQFPLPQHLARADKSDVLQAWNRLHADRAPEELLRQMVLALRIWRPSVVVTDHPDQQVSGSPAQALVVEALHEAFQRAADPKAFPEQLKEIGLDPWEPAKMYCRWEKREGAQISLDLTRVSPRLEATIRDFATSAAGMLADAPVTLPTQRHYHFLKGRGAGAAVHRDLMQGVELAAGGVARRKQTELATLSPEAEKAIRQRRNLVAIVQTPPTELADPNRILTQVGPLLSGMTADQGAPAAFAIADQFVRLGQWDLAREVFLLMVDRYPAHPLSADAYRWLIRHNTSGEARRRHELGQFWAMTQATVRHSKDVSGAGDQRIRGLPETEGVAIRQVGLLGDLEETRRWYRGGFDIGARLAAFGPLFASDPSIQFCLQAARRHLGEFDQAKEWYIQFQREQVNGPWRDAAASELWLNSRTGPPPKLLAFCSQVTARPFLDGDFDDTCWQGLKPLVLHNAVGETTKEYPTEVRLAYDKDFLYLGLRCEHPAERHVPPVKVRPRDADLGPYDRVGLLLDVDRDYSTYFHFQVDQRGCASEDCWGDLTWNPRWFVALHSELTSWQIEAAIPLTELTGDALAVGRVWACNIVRVLPGRGVQAWSLPADVQPRPEGMGLLMFMQEPNAPAARAPKPAIKVP